MFLIPGSHGKAQLQVFSFKLQGAAESPGAFSPSAAALSPRSWSAALHQQATDATMGNGRSTASLAHISVFPSLLVMVFQVLVASAADTLKNFFTNFIELLYLFSEGALSTTDYWIATGK